MRTLAKVVAEIEAAEQRTRDLWKEFDEIRSSGSSSKSVSRVSTATGAKRGPKPKAKAEAAATTDSGKRRGRPPGSSKNGPTLLEKCATLLGKAKKPLLLKEVLERLNESGHNTSAKSFPNVLYQTLNKGVKDKRISKDAEKRYAVA